MKATKLPSGNYRAIAYLGKDENGKPIQKSFTSPDPKHAVALASTYVDKHRVVVDKGSLLVVMQKFFHDREPYLSPTTYDDYKSRYRMLKRYYPAFCKTNIHTISADDIRHITSDMVTVKQPRHRMQKTPRALKPKTVKNYIGFLSSVFTYAGLTLPDYEIPEGEQTDIYVPTDAEIQVLIEATRDTDMFVPILLAAFGPLRRGEICALTYPRDFDGNVIHVKYAMAKKDNKFIIKTPKNKTSNRFIQMPSWVISEIETAERVTDLTPDNITQKFPHILRRAGLPKFRFHDLRHYCVSTLHAQGIPDAYIMQRGGWATDAVLKRVYRHTLADQIQINANRAIAHFDKIYLSARDENS